MHIAKLNKFLEPLSIVPLDLRAPVSVPADSLLTRRKFDQPRTREFVSVCKSHAMRYKTKAHSVTSVGKPNDYPDETQALVRLLADFCSVSRTSA